MFMKFLCIWVSFILTETPTMSATQNMEPTTRLKGFEYQSYQTSILCSPSTAIQFPKNVQEISKILEFALQTNQSVKAIGHRHSVTDIICTDGFPISMENINYTIDNDDGTVTFGAGIQLMDAMIILEQKNKSLLQVPTFGGITLGGALGTGAHGSSLLHPTSISDQVTNLTIIDGTGTLRKISSPEDLKIFRVHLGLLGIIVDITLQTVPLFKMKIENTVESENILSNGKALEWAAEFDAFEMFWFPSTKEVVVAKGTYLADSNTPGKAVTNFVPNQSSLSLILGKNVLETLQFLRATPALKLFEATEEFYLHSNTIGRPPIYTEDGVTLANPAIGYCWRLLSSRCNENENGCAWDNGDQSIFPDDYSIAVHVTELPAVIQTIKSILEKNPASFPLVGIFIRFSKASEALMANSNGRPTVHLEWITPMRSDPFHTSKDGLAAYQAISQSMIKEHNGRPHWGKNGLYYFTQEVLETSISNREQFIGAMKRFDPNEVFLNKFGRRILGESDELDRDPRAIHCALQDYCVCSKKLDCAPRQTCSRLNGFPVCKDTLALL